MSKTKSSKKAKLDDDEVNSGEQEEESFNKVGRSPMMITTVVNIHQLKSTAHKDIKTFIDAIKANGLDKVTHGELYIDTQILEAMYSKLQYLNSVGEILDEELITPDNRGVYEWTYLEMAEKIKQYYPQELNSQGKIKEGTLEEALKAVEIKLDPRSADCVNTVIKEIITIFSDFATIDKSCKFSTFPADRSAPIIEHYKNKIKRGNNKHAKSILDELTILEINSKDNHNTLSSWLNALHLRCAERLKIYATAASGGMYWPSEDKDGKRKFNSEEVKNKSNKKSNHNNTEENSQKIPKPNKFKPCDGCGRTHKPPCAYETHPCYNSTDKPWTESPMGKKLKEKGYDVLQSDVKFEGNNLVKYDFKVRQIIPINQINTKSNSQELISTREQYLLNGLIIFLKRNDEYSRLCGVLIDTGAVHSNYINKDFVETLNENESYINMSSNKLNKVTAAFGSETISSGKLKTKFKNFF